MQALIGGDFLQNSTLKQFLLVTLSAASFCVLFYVCFRYVLWWVLPFLLALGIAHLCEPTVLFLQRKLHFRRGFCAALLTLMMLFLLGGLLSLLGTTLVGEARSLLEGIPAWLSGAPQLFPELLTRLERSSPLLPVWLQGAMRDWLTRTFSDAGALFSALSGRLLTALTDFAAALPQAILAVATTVLAMFFTISAYPTLCGFAREKMSQNARSKICLLRGGVAQSLGHWLRAEMIMLCVTFCELLLGFLLIRQDYALLLAFLIALLDALPVFGTGAVLVPWSLWLILQNKLPRAIALLALYLVTLLVRNIVEPKLIAARAGLPSVVSLCAMYLGFCTFGVAGMVLFPLLLLLAAQVMQAEKEKQGK